VGLPELEIGELLVVPTMGAYTCASASNFNGLDLARIIGIE
jgi:ornithine decarboxylase